MLANLTGTQIGYLGGIIGAVIGLAGGAFGTYCSVKNTNSPSERKFMIKASIWMWIALGIFLGLMFLIPSPYRFLLWIPYGFLLPVGIRYINKQQGEIRTRQYPLG
jgi:hypothetical protein